MLPIQVQSMLCLVLLMVTAISTSALGGGQARYEIDLEQAAVVRQIFAWVGQERATIGEVCRRLTQAGLPTQTGKQTWERSVVWGMLKNPAYKGVAAFGKTVVGQMQPRLRPGRGQSPQPRRPYSTYPVDTPEWIGIPVPALVDEPLFETVQQQLSENRQRAMALPIEGQSICSRG